MVVTANIILKKFAYFDDVIGFPLGKSFGIGSAVLSARPTW